MSKILKNATHDLWSQQTKTLSIWGLIYSEKHNITSNNTKRKSLASFKDGATK